MVASLARRFRAAIAMVCASVFMIAAHPALANTSAAAADVAAPVRDAQGTTLTGGDDQFRQLFAQWQSLDGDTASTTTPSQPAAPIADVAVPSRMPLARASMTSDFGMRIHPVLGGRRAHKGIDLAAPIGTPVYATADGIVSRADRFSSYGLFVSIEHGAQLQTRYAHLSRIAVEAGEHVRKGEIIGYVGTTGRSTGPHLHYEVRVAGEAVNPMPYMVESRAQTALAAAAPGEGGRGDGDDEGE